MAVTKNLPLSAGNNINSVMEMACARLRLMGYEAVPSVVSSKTATLTVSKNCTKRYNFFGLSAKAKATVMVIDDMLDVTVDNVWTNKGLAIVLGLFVFGIFTVTGILGVIEQNKLSDDLICTLRESAGECAANQRFDA